LLQTHTCSKLYLTIDYYSSLTIEDVNKFLVRVFPPPPPRIPVGAVVRLREGLLSEGPLEAGQMAVIVSDDGSSNPYKVRTANGVEHGHYFILDYLVPVDEAVAVRCHSTRPVRRNTHTPPPPSAQRKGHFKDTAGQGLATIDWPLYIQAQNLHVHTRSLYTPRMSHQPHIHDPMKTSHAGTLSHTHNPNYSSLSLTCPRMLLQAEFLATAKGPPPRLPVGTVVRLSDGLDACGPLRAGQTAIIIVEDGTSNPYRVRTVDGEEHSYWFTLENVVQVDEAAAVRRLAAPFPGPLPAVAVWPFICASPHNSGRRHVHTLASSPAQGSREKSKTEQKAGARKREGGREREGWMAEWIDAEGSGGL
jgi:hypothetical protein